MNIALPIAVLPWYGFTFVLSLIAFAVWFYLFQTEKAQLRSGGGPRGGDAGFVPFPRTPGASPTDQDLRDLSLGAFLSGTWGFPVDTLGTNHPAESTATALREAWDVRTPEQARSTLRWLLDSGHRDAFDAVIQVAGPDPSSAGEERLAEAFGQDALPSLAEPRANFIATHGELRRRGFIQSEKDLERGTGAWDYSRAVTVTRFAHTAGLLGDAEAWGFIREAGELARASFHSWDEFLRSYVIGRATWSGMEHFEDAQLTAVIEDVSSGKSSPWKLVTWS